MLLAAPLAFREALPFRKRLLNGVQPSNAPVRHVPFLQARHHFPKFDAALLNGVWEPPKPILGVVEHFELVELLNRAAQVRQ